MSLSIFVQFQIQVLLKLAGYIQGIILKEKETYIVKETYRGFETVIMDVSTTIKLPLIVDGSRTNQMSYLR